VAECIGVVMDEEIEHYRFAVRDLSVLEARWAARQRTFRTCYLPGWLIGLAGRVRK